MEREGVKNKFRSRHTAETVAAAVERADTEAEAAADLVTAARAAVVRVAAGVGKEGWVALEATGWEALVAAGWGEEVPATAEEERVGGRGAAGLQRRVAVRSSSGSVEHPRRPPCGSSLGSTAEGNLQRCC